MGLAAALRAHLGQELGGKGAVLDLLPDLLHLLAGVLGDEALEMCIRDRVSAAQAAGIKANEEEYRELAKLHAKAPNL